jgi:hypothetical protein
VTCPIGTIAEELAGCEAAFEVTPNTVAEFCHWHDKRCSSATPTERWQRRIVFILEHKPEEERAIRLRNYRPWTGEVPRWLAEINLLWDGCMHPWEWDKLQWGERKRQWLERKRLWAEHSTDVDTAHDAQWPDNTWNGENIFEKEAK